jgi:hypothetical protein
MDHVASDHHSGYIAEDGQPKLPPGMREHLLKDLDQGFDF